MPVSRTVSEIFSVKDWRDLELRLEVVQGHWKWRRSIDHTTFYWSASVYRPIHVALSGTVFELLDVEKYREPEI